MKKFFPVLISCFLTTLIFSPSIFVYGQTSQENNQALKPSEIYFIKLRDALYEENQKFKKSNGRDMNSTDWLRYVNKIYPTEVRFPSSATEETKKTYTWSLALGFAWSKYGFGYEKFPAGTKKIMVNCAQVHDLDPHAPPSALGESHQENGSIMMICPPKPRNNSAQIVATTIHELIHQFGNIPQGNEQTVHDKMIHNLPGLMRPGNYPANDYDVLTPKKLR